MPSTKSRNKRNIYFYCTFVYLSFVKISLFTEIEIYPFLQIHLQAYFRCCVKIANFIDR